MATTVTCEGYSVSWAVATGLLKVFSDYEIVPLGYTGK